MELKRVVLVMADISGYTRFMKIHTMSLLHAEAIITELLEAVLDHAEFPLTLSKLEGDAAFMYATLDDESQAQTATRDILRQVTAFFEAFHAKARALIACDTCRCEGCNHIADLRLKAFLHVGEAAFKKIRQFEELAGEDVILIHRLLKNTVPAKEYILLTEQFYALSGGLGDGPLEARTEEAEGLGTVGVRVYYPAGDSTPLPPRPAPAPPSPDNPELMALANRMNDYAVKRALGRIEQPRFNHLPNQKLNPLSLLDYFVVGIGANIMATLQHQRGQKQAQGG
jgi:class 3 adenylate cyclase